jgi:hypothetical protein
MALTMQISEECCFVIGTASHGYIPFRSALVSKPPNDATTAVHMFRLMVLDDRRGSSSLS